MANKILAASPLSNNDILVLARLLKHRYKTHRMDNNPLGKQYVKHLMTLVGLGFTAIMEDGALALPMQAPLNQFLLYFDLLQKKEDFRAESLAAARIISQAAFLFERLRYPDYYAVFKRRLHGILGKDFAGSAKQKGEASRLMALLLVR